jgi:hypothetical protein
MNVVKKECCAEEDNNLTPDELANIQRLRERGEKFIIIQRIGIGIVNPRCVKSSKTTLIGDNND